MSIDTAHAVNDPSPKVPTSDPASSTDSETTSSPASSRQTSRQLAAADGGMKTVPVGRILAQDALIGRYIYVAGLGWHGWDSKRWSPVVSDDEVLAACAKWVDRWVIGLRASGQPLTTVSEATKYFDLRQLRAALDAAKMVDGVVVAAEELDSQAWLLNTQNGIVDLRDGSLLPHDPKWLMSKITSAPYCPEAAHPDWDKALSALQDPETASYLRKFVGAAATGLPGRTGPVLFHYGEGSNGKSAIVGAIRAVLGDYATAVPDKLLTASANEHDTMWTTLRGVRLAYLEELPDGHRLPVVRIKKLTETPELSGRRMGENYVTWRSTHSLMITTNHTPQVSETDDGTWRRLALIRYVNSYFGSDRDTTLRERLTASGPAEAALAWIVAGAAEWRRCGQRLDDLPPTVEAATNEWRFGADVLGPFLDENVEITGVATDRISTTELHESFTKSDPTGKASMSLTDFSKRLKVHPFTRKTMGVNRGPGNRMATAVSGIQFRRR